MKLKGQTALVTGGARGIGRAMAEAFAREGATVCIADLDGDECARVAAEIGPAAWGQALNVADMASVRAAVAAAEARTGGIDILVNNAGVFDMGPTETITEASYDRIFAVNVKGLLFMSQAVATSMMARGKGGRIINMASQAGRRGEGLVAVYCASKAAVISLTQSLGLDLIRHGIRVNGIAPGVIDTPMWDHVDALFAKYENLQPGEKKRMVGKAVPAGRMGRPQDFQGIAVFLASSDSDYIVAQTYNVDGGNWMS